MARSVGSGYVKVSPEVAFEAWTDLRKFPEFMPGVIGVKEAGGGFAIQIENNGAKEVALVGHPVIEKPRRVSWRSSKGGTTWNGEVTFRRTGNDECEVRLTMDFEPEEMRRNPTKPRVVTPTWPVGDTMIAFKRYIEEA